MTRVRLHDDTSPLKEALAESYVMLWLKQNDAVERLADQKAYDALPSVLREIVSEAPIQLSCVRLLDGCRKLGATPVANAALKLLLEWTSSKAAP